MQFTKALQHTIIWKALNTVLGFCINVLLVRLLGADASGQFFYAIALLSFVTLLISWSLESGITYYASNQAVYIGSITLFILPLLVVQGLISWLVSGWLISSINKQQAIIFILGNIAIIYFSALLYARKWFVSLNVIPVVVNAFVLIFLWYAWFAVPFTETGTATDVYIYGFALQAMLLAFIVLMAKDPGQKHFDLSLAKKIFRYSSVAFISNILFFLVTRLDYYFVQRYCDAVALSNYVQVSKMGQLLVLLPSMMAAVIFPYSATNDSKDHLMNLQSLCRIIVLFFIPVAIIISVAGNWLFPWLFGNGFVQMYPAMLLYLTGFFSLSIVTVMAAYLAGKAMLKKNMVATVIALLAVIAGDILLIPRWGINAAALVSSIAYLLCMLYLLQVYRITMNCRPADFFIVKRSDIMSLLRWFKK